MLPRLIFNLLIAIPESFVAAVGILGVALGSAGLLAYLIMQVPEFRETIGNWSLGLMSENLSLLELTI